MTVCTEIITSLKIVNLGLRKNLKRAKMKDMLAKQSGNSGNLEEKRLFRSLGLHMTLLPISKDELIISDIHPAVWQIVRFPIKRSIPSGPQLGNIR